MLGAMFGLKMRGLEDPVTFMTAYDSLQKVDSAKIRLFSDGCTGQNENLTMVSMAATWFKSKSLENITEMELHFPVTGHSFLPADSVFGFIETAVRKEQEILNPQHYSNINEAAPNVVKSSQNLHFQISAVKRIKIQKIDNRIVICGESTYLNDTGIGKTIVRRGKSLSQLQPIVVNISVPVCAKKITEVANLLEKRFGSEWQQDNRLKFYTIVLNSRATEEEAEEDYCETGQFINPYDESIV
ncbi:hypothetical protein ANN_19122 [Periplaneta americana]|uniref:Uncharacterized protein n=1 Tax=Periplaneta americana TaxID=6978 RepID=A0ABQ8S9I3_PERAM|nr:hypothetical protein ANN_19122 [Periplaneta americana]